LLNETAEDEQEDAVIGAIGEEDEEDESREQNDGAMVSERHSLHAIS